MSQQDSPNPQTAVDVVLSSRGDLSFRDGIKIEFLREAWAEVMKVEGAQRVAAVASMGAKMIEIKNKVEDSMLDWAKMAGDEEKLGLSAEDMIQLARLNEPFQSSVKVVEKDRNEKTNNIMALYAIIQGKTPAKRGDAFKDYVKEHLSAKGKNFFGNLKQFMRRKESVRDLIQLLNQVVMNRNRDAKFYNVSTLQQIDVQKAIDIAKGWDKDKKDWVFDELEAAMIKEKQFTFHESGIFISGTYADTSFPVFSDETDWPPVMVTSVGETETLVVEEPASGTGESQETGHNLRKRKKDDVPEGYSIAISNMEAGFGPLFGMDGLSIQGGEEEEEEEEEEASPKKKAKRAPKSTPKKRGAPKIQEIPECECPKAEGLDDD
jgi:hypothetical protein